MQGKYRELHRLLLWRQLPPGWDPRRERPLFLEIGFGNGEYLLRQAQSRPHHDFLGIDLHWGSVRRCLRRLAQAGVDNVRLLQVDAHTALRYLFPDQCFEEFVALFPCPWPKRDHESLRLFSTRFMAHLRRTCRGGGLVVTDHPGLRDYALAQAPGSGLGVRLEEVEARYDTKYERRWSGQGQQLFFELHYQPEGPAPVQAIAEVDLKTLRVSHLNPDSIVLQGVVEAGLVISFRQQLYDPQQKIWMGLATVVEDHLNQTFWVECRHHKGEWLVRPALGGGYFPTIGLQRTLELVQQAIESGQSGAADAVAG